LLIVDDDLMLRRQLARSFSRRGFSVHMAANFDEAVAVAQKKAPEFAVVDLKMPGRSGLGVLAELKRIDVTTSVVILTGFGSIANAVEAMRLGATNYLAKPADADDILKAFARGEPSAREGAVVDYQAPSLARAEWEHVHRVLSDSGGNVSEAARRLGIHRRSLQRKLNRPAPG
jgi:two-component system response regulator RegA